MTEWRPLSITGAWEVTPSLYHDERGTNAEVFKASLMHNAVGREFTSSQVNYSVSKTGVLRGVHVAVGAEGTFAGGMEKFVTAAYGSVFDVIVDLRTKSPTWGTWEAVLLTAEKRNAVFLCAGLGHAILALSEGSILLYLCSQEYDPALERTIDALDPALGIQWPTKDMQGNSLNVVRSQRDNSAVTLAQAVEQGILPAE